MPLTRRDFILALCALPLGQRIRLRIALRASGDAERGARMALAEAQRAALLLGASVDAVADARAADVVVFGGTQEELVRLLHETAALLINLTVPAAAVGAAARLKHILVPGDWWSPGLEKYGAAQLNARYRAFAKKDMTAAAWAGWFAVKAAWESAARARSSEPQALARFLAGRRAGFDGHKGVLLTFDPATGILR